MFKKVLGFILLPFLFLSIAPIPSIEAEKVSEGISTSNNDLITKSDNPNNHPLVSYNDSEQWAGEYMDWDVTLSEACTAEGESDDYFDISLYFYIIIKLTDENGYDEFEEEIENTYFTLYDITNGEYNPIGLGTLVKDEEFSIHPASYSSTGVYDGGAMIQFNVRWFINDFGVTLEEYHDYCIGFNINPGDDLRIYSTSFQKEVPHLSALDITSSEDSIVIDYTVAEAEGLANVFEYNELYFEVDNRRYDLDETSGQVVVDGLKPATEYDVVFGYDVNKIIYDRQVVPLTNEITYSATTIVPSDYSFEEEIIASFILLIILLIIFLILILMIVYWNHQRRKISGMALVIGEDTEAYDPVYQYNYYQEDESAVPNATSSNQGEEVYGYFDEVQDNEYYQEEPYGYFDEVKDESYQNEEIAGYFDEVQEDYYEDDVYDIDHSDEEEWL